jgi:hypothetical protein
MQSKRNLFFCFEQFFQVNRYTQATLNIEKTLAFYNHVISSLVDFLFATEKDYGKIPTRASIHARFTSP